MSTPHTQYFQRKLTRIQTVRQNLSVSGKTSITESLQIVRFPVKLFPGNEQVKQAPLTLQLLISLQQYSSKPHGRTEVLPMQGYRARQ